MSAYHADVTLSEIDRSEGFAKGTAFRAFKQLAETLQEGLDYQVLDHQKARQAIAELRAAGRLYHSSINVVLLSTAAAERVSLAARQLAAGGR